MTWIWMIMVASACVFGVIGGKMDAVSAAALEGAQSAVTLTVSMAGALCLWSGVMKIMERAGILKRLVRVLRRPLSRLFPQAGSERALEPIAANVSANLMGLGNAATPAGIKAAKMLMKSSPDGTATDELCLFVVMNTASLQLLPTTAASLRAAAGAAAPFDIVPAVWITSAVSLACGIGAVKLLRRITGRRR